MRFDKSWICRTADPSTWTEWEEAKKQGRPAAFATELAQLQKRGHTVVLMHGGPHSSELYAFEREADAVAFYEDGYKARERIVPNEGFPERGGGLGFYNISLSISGVRRASKSESPNLVVTRAFDPSERSHSSLPSPQRERQEYLKKRLKEALNQTQRYKATMRLKLTPRTVEIRFNNCAVDRQCVGCMLPVVVDIGLRPVVRDTWDILCEDCAAEAGFHQPYADYPISAKYAEHIIRMELLDKRLSASKIIETISRDLVFGDELAYYKRLTLDQRSVTKALRRMVERGEIERKDSGNGSDSLYSLTPKGEAAYWEVPVEQLDELHKQVTGADTEPAVPTSLDRPADETRDAA